MASQHESGTTNLSGSLDTETTLNTTDPETTAGIFQLLVDAGNLANGETLILRIYDKTTGSGDSQLKIWEATYQHALGEPLIASPAIILLHGWKMTIEQSGGTGRSYDWSIRDAAS